MEVSTVSIESLMPVIRMQLETGGRAPLVVTGVSMHPTLRHCRDLVELVPVRQPLKRGDLILYRRESGTYVLHRIVSKPTGGSFICSGDNHWEPENVTERQVIALVDTYIRDGKRISVEQWSCKLWVRLWIGLFPVRRPLLQLRRWLGRLRMRMKRMLKV